MASIDDVNQSTCIAGQKEPHKRIVFCWIPKWHENCLETSGIKESDKQWDYLEFVFGFFSLVDTSSCTARSAHSTIAYIITRIAVELKYIAKQK